MFSEDIATIDDGVCFILRKYGPDRHVDGHEILTMYIERLLNGEVPSEAIYKMEHEAKD